MELIKKNGVLLHRWSCGPSTYWARPEAGARLMRWELGMADGKKREVLHWPEAVDASVEFAKVRGGNPILFPFAGRSYVSGKLGFWKDGAGQVRPMPNHGFARDGHFDLKACEASGFTAEFQPGSACREAYPFEYRFSVRYVFGAISFRVFLELENLGSEPLLWSGGHHFYFKLPWHENLNRRDYRFQIPAKKCFKHGPDGTLQPVKPFTNAGSFGDTENNDRIFTRLTGNQAVFGPNGGEEDIGVRILEDSETYSTWNAFVIWSEQADSPYYCVEPWMGAPNSAEHGKGLHAVNSGERSSFGVEVALL